jgi:mRNA interferase HicA
MKRRLLVKALEEDGWKLARHGSNHDVYTKGNKTEIIERHREIPERLAKAILKRNGLK